jgi:hypothetical protein
MRKSEGKRKLDQIIERYSMIPPNTLRKLSEQDITTKFVLPMLESFNWNVYKITEEGPEIHEKAFKERRDVHKGLPDIILTSQNGKIFVEVKRPPLREAHAIELQKYKKSDLIVLTSFEDLRMYTLFGKRPKQRYACANYTSYPKEFNKLWDILSNSEKGKATRAAYKAAATRARAKL